MIVSGSNGPPAGQPLAGHLYYDLVHACLYVYDGINWIPELGRSRPVAPVVPPHVHRVIGPRISLADAMPHAAEVWLAHNGLRQPDDFIARRLLFGDCTRLVIDFVSEEIAGMYHLVWGGEAVHNP